MKGHVWFSVILLIILETLLFGFGCTKIDKPVREDENGGTDLSDDSGDEAGDADGCALTIEIEKNEILDTEPLILRCEGETGDVSWSAQPLSGTFQPETGSPVLFIPADVSETTSVIILAEDEEGYSGSVTITIVDEGDPPSPGDVLINEIGWAGTLTSSYDEFIELINKEDRPFYLGDWIVENGGGSGVRLGIYGRIEAESVFLVTNYEYESGQSAITVRPDMSDARLSLVNSACGPYILKDGNETVMDTVGDGGGYLFGANEEGMRASMARYSDSCETSWNPGSWYTEGLSVNLSDSTLGTPGGHNSDTPQGAGPADDSACALVTEYSIDPEDPPELLGMDWAELYITRGGSISQFTVTDIDGEDSPITGGEEITVQAGDYLLVVWHGGKDPYESGEFYREDNVFYIPDTTPTGTKDQVVLLSGDLFVDGLAYTSVQELWDYDSDRDYMLGSGWSGDPIRAKHASRMKNGEGYAEELCAGSWDTAAPATPGAEN